MKLEIGTKVRVQIADPREWATGAADALTGMTGIVEEIKPDVDAWGRTRKAETPFLVRFDKAAPKWWMNQSAALAWHFDAKDLVAL